MKDLIRQILREETSGLTDGQIKYGYDLMNILTKGYHWYYDTPEQPFDYTPNSIWLINPEKNDWIIQLEKSGSLWFNYLFTKPFSMYLNIDVLDFELFIKIWVEDILKRGVNETTSEIDGLPVVWLKDVIKKGVVETSPSMTPWDWPFEDALKNGKQLK
jgi:hypothetical protein